MSAHFTNLGKFLDFRAIFSEKLGMSVLKILGELCGDASVLLTMCLDSGKRTGNIIDFNFVSDTRSLVDARVILTGYSPLDEED